MALPGPPLVMVYGMSKVCSAVIVRKMSATMIDGISIGSRFSVMESMISATWRLR